MTLFYSLRRMHDWIIVAWGQLTMKASEKCLKLIICLFSQFSSSFNSIQSFVVVCKSYSKWNENLKMIAHWLIACQCSITLWDYYSRIVRRYALSINSINSGFTVAPSVHCFQFLALLIQYSPHLWSVSSSVKPCLLAKSRNIPFCSSDTRRPLIVATCWMMLSAVRNCWWEGIIAFSNGNILNCFEELWFSFFTVVYSPLYEGKAAERNSFWTLFSETNCISCPIPSLICSIPSLISVSVWGIPKSASSSFTIVRKDSSYMVKEFIATAKLEQQLPSKP